MYGADVDEIDANGCTALHWAALRGGDPLRHSLSSREALSEWSGIVTRPLGAAGALDYGCHEYARL